MKTLFVARTVGGSDCQSRCLFVPGGDQASLKIQLRTDDPRRMPQQFRLVERLVKLGGQLVQNGDLVRPLLFVGIKRLQLLGEFPLAEMRADSCHQLFFEKRFDQVVVGTNVETSHLAIDGV